MKPEQAEFDSQAADQTITKEPPMGLDMYLHRITWVRRYGDAQPKLSVLEDGAPFPGVDPSKVKMLTEEVAYWRKANQVHSWFVDNVQGGKDDCGDYEVAPSTLAALVEACQAVLDDRSKASTLLPTQSGFFFGSYDYDEGYFQDLEDTVRQLKPLVHDLAPNQWYEYHSSW